MCVHAHTDTWMEMEEEVDTLTLRLQPQQSDRDGSAWCEWGTQTSNPQCEIMREWQDLYLANVNSIVKILKCLISRIESRFECKDNRTYDSKFWRGSYIISFLFERPPFCCNRTCTLGFVDFVDGVLVSFFFCLFVFSGRGYGSNLPCWPCTHRSRHSVHKCKPRGTIWQKHRSMSMKITLHWILNIMFYTMVLIDEAKKTNYSSTPLISTYQ